MPAIGQSFGQGRQKAPAAHSELPEAALPASGRICRALLALTSLLRSAMDSQDSSEALYDARLKQELCMKPVIEGLSQCDKIPIGWTSVQVRIKVVAAAVNFADALQLQGLYQEKPKLPFVPGSEVSGRIIEIGSDVRTLSVGDTVSRFAQLCMKKLSGLTL